MTVKKFYDIAKKELFPLCRSITGNGLKRSLYIIKKNFNKLKINKIKSGTKVFDWKVPQEWNILDGYILDNQGKKILDFKENNLHVIGYSAPINKILKKKTLIKLIHTLPKQRDAIPYITSYYKKRVGYCMTHNNLGRLKKEYKDNSEFKAVVKSSFKKNGDLPYGEIILKGKSKQEILISTYLCHPSMANNELSGPIVSMALINFFKKKKKLNKTIRFIFIPETIGSIVFIKKNLSNLKKNIIGGYNLTCIGDERMHSCMKSKYKNSPSDKSLMEAYKKLKIKFKEYSFLERGSDERQYNSPGVDLPISSIFRSKYGTYPEYHTSLDNFNFVTIKGIEGGYKVAKKAIEILMKKEIPQNLIMCEPQMGKRGLYPNLSSKTLKEDLTKHFMGFLQYADGKNDLYEISKILKTSYKKIKKINKILLKNNLIRN